MVDINQNDLKAMQTLIRLVSAGARKEDVSSLSVDWNTVLPLATEQHVIPLVACALLYSPGLACPDQLREYLLNVMRAESSANMIRRQRIMHLLKEMKNAGIEAKVLKGYAIARCYAYPECRGSVDTDLLIDIKQEKQAVCFLEDRGFHVEPRAATSQHAVCQHKKYGMVELHVALYAELIQDVWFQKMEVSDLAQEPSISVVENDGCFETIGHTDQLIFLTLHMVKHFILEGLTLRMMLDIAQYFTCNHDWIDSVRFWDTMEKMQYAKLVNCILGAMVLYGGFGFNDFPGLNNFEPKNVGIILADLHTGGYLGVKEKTERLESGMEYNHQLMRKQKSVLQYTMHMVGWKMKSGMVYMFPTAKVLRKIYPVVEKRPILIPVLWLWQVCSFPFRKIISGALERDVRTEDSGVTVVAKKRVEMFRELDMI